MKVTRYLWLILGVLIWSGTSAASPVTFDIQGARDSSVNTFTDGKGMSVGVFPSMRLVGATTKIQTILSDELDRMAPFKLSDGESKDINFFDFVTDAPSVENGVTGSIGWFHLDASLSFNLPEISVTAKGSGGWGTISVQFPIARTWSAGAFKWYEKDFLFDLPDGNTIQVLLEDGLTISCDSQVTVHATITNLGGGTSAVPVPSALMLLGSGLAGMIGWRYLKR